MDGLVQSENAKVLELWGFPSMGDPLNGRFINPMKMDDLEFGYRQVDGLVWKCL